MDALELQGNHGTARFGAGPAAVIAHDVSWSVLNNIVDGRHRNRCIAMNANEIMKALDSPARVYQREAVQAAMDPKDDVVPLLPAHLEQVLPAPEKYVTPEYESNLPLYAVYLLSHHRVREAHPLFIALMSLPEEMPLDLFSDTIHEGFPIALWKTCGGDPADIIQLVENRKANEYCRASAIHALSYGIAEKVLPREKVVEFLQGLFTGEESTPNKPMIWNTATSTLARLWPGESIHILEKAFEDELVEPFFIGMEDVEHYLEERKEARLAAFERGALKELARTPHEEMSWWACFNPSQNQDYFFDDGSHAQKRKQARAARKKGRSRKKRKH
jgi:hypothetical protein